MKSAPTTEKSNLCFWIDHSNTCTDIKIGCVSMVTAVAAVALAASLLVILAQQGILFEGLNALTQIAPEWVYLCAACAVALLLSNSVVIGAMMHGFLNKMYSEKELTKLGFTAYIQKELLFEKMPLGSYWKVTKEVIKESKNRPGCAAVYAVLTKDGKGITNTKGFKTREERDAYLTTLQEHLFVDGKKFYRKNPEFPAENIVANFGKQHSDLPKDSYCYCEQTLPSGENIYLLAFNLDDSTKVRYFKNENDVKDILGNITFLINEFKQKSSELLKKEYFAYPFEIFKDASLYPVIVKDAEGKNFFYFFSKPTHQTSFCQSLNHFKDGRVRQLHLEWFVQGAGMALLGQMKESEKKPLYLVVEHPTDKIAHLICCSTDGKITSDYISLDSSQVEIQTKYSSHVKLDSDKWKTLPLTQLEQDFLRKDVFNKFIGKWKGQECIGVNEFVVQEIANYVCIVAGYPSNSTVDRKDMLFKNGDPAIDTLIKNDFKSFKKR